MSNSSGNATEDRDDPWVELNWPYTVSEILVAVAAIIGNFLVILVFGKERRLRRRTKYYIISLAVADLLVGLLGIPFAILASVGLPRNFYLCLFTVSLLVVLCTISIFCLVAVSIDRYWAILYPLSYSRNVSSRTAIGIILVCWISGAFVGFLPLLGWHEESALDGKCLFVKVMDYDYLVFLYLATIVVPAILLAAFYAHIYRVVLNQLRQIVMLSPRSSEQPCSSPGRSSGVMLRMLGAAQKREVKATQNLSIIVLFFIICWMPLYTINCVKAFCKDCDISQALTDSCIILSHLNSSFNPFLYAYHLKDFRVALRNLLFGGKGIPSRTMRSLPRDISIHIQRPAADNLMIRNTSFASRSSIMKEGDSVSSEREEISDRQVRRDVWTTREEVPNNVQEDVVSKDRDSMSRFNDLADEVFEGNGDLYRGGLSNRRVDLSGKFVHFRSLSLQYGRSSRGQTKYGRPWSESQSVHFPDSHI